MTIVIHTDYKYSRPPRTASPTSDPTTTFARQKRKLTHPENQTDSDCHSKHTGSENWEYMGDELVWQLLQGLGPIDLDNTIVRVQLFLVCISATRGVVLSWWYKSLQRGPNTILGKVVDRHNQPHLRFAPHLR